MNTRAARVLSQAYVILVFAGIGGLQMYHVDAGLLTDYGADLLAPPYLYFVFRHGRLRLRPPIALLTVFGGCLAWEWAQRYDLGGTPLAITRGTFDPLDIVAYGVGVFAAWALDAGGFVPGDAFRSPRADRPATGARPGNGRGGFFFF